MAAWGTGLALFVLLAGMPGRLLCVRMFASARELCHGSLGQPYYCDTGHCCGESGCCTYYYELWWFWLVWSLIILLSCCCAYYHRRIKMRSQLQQRQRQINMLAFEGANNYPEPPLDIRLMAMYKLPAYEEVVSPHNTPPPPYSALHQHSLLASNSGDGCHETPRDEAGVSAASSMRSLTQDPSTEAVPLLEGAAVPNGGALQDLAQTRASSPTTTCAFEEPDQNDLPTQAVTLVKATSQPILLDDKRQRAQPAPPLNRSSDATLASAPDDVAHVSTGMRASSLDRRSENAVGAKRHAAGAPPSAPSASEGTSSEVASPLEPTAQRPAPPRCHCSSESGHCGPGAKDNDDDGGGNEEFRQRLLTRDSGIDVCMCEHRHASVAPQCGGGGGIGESDAGASVGESHGEGGERLVPIASIPESCELCEARPAAAAAAAAVDGALFKPIVGNNGETQALV
uniref:Uncharacterized protein LOC116940434 n=1 Tax=Petromyzon marinus TaxID=7757 RepID=A0AAJ7WQK4_PETMA|nr:uncharacterized protein LOC116940434 [Petromyzon marinus]